MGYTKKFRIEPDSKVKLDTFDPSEKGGYADSNAAENEIAHHVANLDELQALLYADGRYSLLIVLQGLDGAGKDGTIRHVFNGVNPQGTKVQAFKVPTPEEAAHDFLWRAHKATPGKGEIVIFNRSHYEDVLVVRVHDLVPKKVWSKRYKEIRAFERNLSEGGTVILKFFLNISYEEQLDRFRKRLDDPQRQWKISESDYTERKYWNDYQSAYEEALAETSTDYAPWFVIPSNHKWFRNLAISSIIVNSLRDLHMKVPAPRVDLDDIRRKYHGAEETEKKVDASGKADAD
ncbi:polyphosphate kinase 2 family protein [Hyphomicrobium sp.]|uniref:polyphosphate kinase 2 family protein n=1 Tax=Hyphomicrobium sp. TaxID=82 RepID=UPI002E2FE6EB|nr:polyphosphate kinase 2 family protein [Hyphomicrobium sp.]HEX2842517.1 polyphosphate kinase 2 family protein [Hyphomicrobium sp.]